MVVKEVDVMTVPGDRESVDSGGLRSKEGGTDSEM